MLAKKYKCEVFCEYIFYIKSIMKDMHGCLAKLDVTSVFDRLYYAIKEMDT